MIWVFPFFIVGIIALGAMLVVQGPCEERVVGVDLVLLPQGEEGECG